MILHRVVNGAILASGLLHSQTQRDAKLAFEVVSVKASGTNRVVIRAGESMAVRLRGVTYADARVTCNTDLKSIISEAYSVKDYQIAGPDWLSSNTYEVIGSMPPGTTTPDARRMLQTMLEDRFGLRLHHESKEIPVYVLMLAKDGFKGHRAEDQQGSTRGNGPGMLTATAITFDELATWLSHMGTVPVVNQTRLEGRYQVALHWEVEGPPETRQTSAMDGGLASALSDQLGVKLEKRKMPYDLLVIENIERTPTGN